MVKSEKTMRVDVKDSVVEELTINDKVTLAVKGTVKELEASRSFGEDDKKTYPGSVILLVDSVKVAAPNAFAELAEADAGDDEDA